MRTWLAKTGCTQNVAILVYIDEYIVGLFLFAADC